MTDNNSIQDMQWSILKMQTEYIVGQLNDTNRRYYELVIALIELRNIFRDAAENASSDEAREAYNVVLHHIECLL